LTDINTSAPVTCENYAATPMRGALISYRLYWVDGNNTIFRSWADTFYAPSF
jgi:hypothetical protein